MKRKQTGLLSFSFAQQCIDTGDWSVATYNGYHPDASYADLQRQLADAGCAKQTARSKRLLLLIHSADAANLCCSGSIETVLASLQKAFRISFLLSVDHLNSAFLWKGERAVASALPCLLRHHLATYQPFYEETSFENCFLLANQSAVLCLRSLKRVLENLPVNAQQLFRMLATAQAQLDGSVNGAGVSLRWLYQRGKEDFLFATWQAFRMLLGEFLDHKIIVEKKGPPPELQDLLFIPHLDAAALEAVFE